MDGSPGRPRAPFAPVPAERVRDEHPEDRSWRADALAKSRHSRILDELLRPVEDFDVRRAAAVCARVCRSALGDFAPALLLAPAAERRRLRALAAYSLVLFDFAHQGGIEGEGLAAINRWEFDLERSLAGEPPGQPVFVAMTAEEEARPWSRQTLAELGRLARGRVARPRPGTAAEAAREASAVGAALAAALLPAEPPRAAAELAAALLRLRSLQNLAEELRRHRSRLPRERLPETWHRELSGAQVADAVAEEAGELRALVLRSSQAIPALPPPFRTPARYLALAGLALLERIEERGGALREASPHLGIGTRLRLLSRARWGKIR